MCQICALLQNRIVCQLKGQDSRSLQLPMAANGQEQPPLNIGRKVPSKSSSIIAICFDNVQSSLARFRSKLGQNSGKRMYR